MYDLFVDGNYILSESFEYIIEYAIQKKIRGNLWIKKSLEH